MVCSAISAAAACSLVSLKQTRPPAKLVRGRALPTTSRYNRTASLTSNADPSSLPLDALVNSSSVSNAASPVPALSRVAVEEDLSRREKRDNGLGIVEFFRAKNFLITGGFGLLGKALVEKILRVQPEVGQIFLLARPKNGDSCEARLYHEVINSELFRHLQEIHGEAYEGFMRSKLTIISGDITLHNLGICYDNMKRIINEVHVIVNSAASTNFDERYDQALLVNTRGAENVIEFSKLISSLQLVMHVSTAYVNGHKEGFVYEDPLSLEEIIPRAYNEIDPRADFYIKREEELIQDIKRKFSSSPKSLSVSLKDLGMQRATKCESFNTYVFTKALGETLVNKKRKDLPVVILRPSIIGSTIMEPFHGWIEGCRMADPIISSYAKGKIHGIVAASSTMLDMIPLDMVVNAMLAIIRKHANEGGLEVYHTTSSSTNSLSVGDLMNYSYKHFSQNPYIDRHGKLIKVDPFIFHPNVTDFLTHEHQWLEKEGGQSTKAREKILNYMKWMANIYIPYTLRSNCRLDNSKTKQLFSELSFDEKQMFNFGIEDIDWEHFIRNIHIPGLWRHVQKY